MTRGQLLCSSQAACLIRVPTEVIKTRTQTSTYGPLVTSSWASAKQVLKTDGLPGFYRGFFTTIIREVRVDQTTLPVYAISDSKGGTLDPVHVNTVSVV